MCQLIKRTSLTVLFCILLSRISYGTHIRGGYLTGEKISIEGFTYRFTVTLYRDQGGVPAQPGTFNFGYTSASEVIVDPVSQGFIEDLIDINGDATEVIIYQVDHTFPSVGSYKVSYFEQNRNPGVRNMFASGNTAFLIESTFLINPSIESNTSPTFTDPLCFFGNIGDIYTRNLKAFDADGDSLSYRLTIPLKGLDEEGNSLPVDNYLLPNASTFASERSDNQGRAIFQLDAVTGQLVFDSPREVGEYNIAIIIDEWRDDVKISSVNYDFQLIIADLPVNSTFRGTCPENINKTGIEFNLPFIAYVDYKQAFTQDGFTITNADSILIENELITRGKVEIIIETNTTENGQEFRVALQIFGLTVEDAMRGFYVFNFTGFKDGESYTTPWFLKVDNLTSTDNKRLLQEISLYPNPSSSSININAANPMTNPRIAITNISGKICFEDYFSSSRANITINISEFIKGIYFIKLQTEEGSLTYKFLKI